MNVGATRDGLSRCDLFHKFIVFQGIVKGKGLQALVQILYQILDKTRNVVT